MRDGVRGSVVGGRRGILKAQLVRDSLLESAAVLLHKDELTQARMMALALKWSPGASVNAASEK